MSSRKVRSSMIKPSSYKRGEKIAKTVFLLLFSAISATGRGLSSSTTGSKGNGKTKTDEELRQEIRVNNAYVLELDKIVRYYDDFQILKASVSRQESKDAIWEIWVSMRSYNKTKAANGVTIDSHIVSCIEEKLQTHKTEKQKNIYSLALTIFKEYKECSQIDTLIARIDGISFIR